MPKIKANQGPLQNKEEVIKQEKNKQIYKQFKLNRILKIRVFIIE